MTLTGNWSYPTAVRFGTGRISELGEACAAAGISRPLLVTDRGLAGLPITDRAREIMAAAGLGDALFAEVDPNPNEINLAAGVAAYRAGNHDGVVAFGGGSPALAEASRRASTNSSQTHLMSSMSRNSPSGSSQNMRVSVWWCTRTSSNPFDLRSVSESSVYFALSFVRMMVVGDAGRSGQEGEGSMPIGGARRSGASRCVADRAGASRQPRRGAFPRAKGRAKSPYLFHHIEKKTRPGNGTRDAPQLRQPLPRRRPAVHVQHEVDDRDVMTDLGPRPHLSTRFTRPGPMEKNNGLTQHASRNSVPALEIGDPGSEKARRQRSPMARRDWSAKIAYGLQFEKSAQRNDFRDRPERPDVFVSPSFLINSSSPVSII